jgi:winged helix-turn helix protein
VSGFGRSVRGILSSREGALMPRHSPYRIDLTGDERRVLESLARSYTLPYWQVVRAQMVLLAAEGLRNDQIADRLRCRREVVSQWRKRFFEQRLAGLEDRPRRGRPPVFPPSGPR